MTNIQLSTENLSFTYPDGTQALKNINIEIEKGEKVAIIGPNGAGKSTLFSHFNGLTEPTSGCVKIEGKAISFEKDELLKVRQKVGIVFQDPNDQLFAPTVKEDIAFGPMNLGLSYDEVEKRVEDALKMVGMENYENKTPHHLSGGQQKRIAIAGIIAMKPEIMILDEPTAGLDPAGRDEILELLARMRRDLGITIILVSHSMEDVAKYVDRLFVMNDGELMLEGAPKEVFRHYKELEAVGLAAPQVTYIMHELKEKGLDVDLDATTIDEAKQTILDALMHRPTAN